MGISLSQPPSPSYPVETMAMSKPPGLVKGTFPQTTRVAMRRLGRRWIFDGSDGNVAEVWFLCVEACGQTKRNPIGIGADPKVSFF